MTEKHYIGDHDGAGEQLPAPQHELQALDRPRLTAKPNGETLDDRDRPARSRGRMFDRRMWADGQYAAARRSHGARSLRSWRTRSPARRPPPRPSRCVAGLVASIAVLIALTGVAQSSPWRPAAMSTAAYRALMLRSQALNRIYHLGAYSLIPPAMPVAAYRGLMLRSEALNKKYGVAQRNTAPAPKPTTAAGGFSWTAFGIGAAAVAALAFLLAGAIAAKRSGRRIVRVL